MCGAIRVDDLAEQLVIDRRVGRRRPPRRRRQQLAAGGLIVIRRRVEQRQCHSAEISATAARAADSSTIAFFAANAAINDGDGEVVDLPGQAAGDLVDQRDRVVGEQGVGAAREREMVLHVARRLRRRRGRRSCSGPRSADPAR